MPILVPNELQRKVLDWLTSDLTPDLLFKNPFEDIPSSEELYEWSDKPEDEKLRDLLETSGGTVEQFLIPQTPLEYPLFAAAPFYKMAKGAIGLRRAAKSAPVAHGAELMTRADADSIRIQRGLLESHFAENVDEALDAVEAGVDPLAETYRTHRFSPEFLGSVVEADQPIARRLLKRAQQKINDLLGGPQVLEQSIAVPKPPRHAEMRPPGWVEPTGVKKRRLIKRKSTEKRVPFDDEYSWELEAPPRTNYEIRYDRGGDVDPETNLYRPFVQEGRGGVTYRGLTRGDLGERTTPIIKKTTKEPWNPYQQEELHAALQEKAHLLDDAGFDWLPGARKLDEGAKTFPHSLHPEDEMTRKQIKFGDALDKEYQKSLIDDLPSVTSESHARPTIQKARLKELEEAKKSFESVWGIDFANEMPATKRLLDAELDYSSYLSVKKNKAKDFVGKNEMWETKLTYGVHTTSGKPNVEIRATFEYLWTKVRSLRERSRIARSLGDVVEANKYDRLADDTVVIARNVEKNKGWNEEVIEAMSIAEGARVGKTHVLEDFGSTPEHSPFHKSSYADIVEKNKAVPQKKQHIRRIVEDDSTLGKVRLKKGNEYVLPRKKESATSPMKHVPTQEEKLAMVNERRVTRLKAETLEIEKMIEQFGTVPDKYKRYVLRDIITRLKEARGSMEPIVRINR